MGHPAHDTYWEGNILEGGFNTHYAQQVLTEQDNLISTSSEMEQWFASPLAGDFSLVDGFRIEEKAMTHVLGRYDFCGYPRGEEADLGAIEFSTTHEGLACASKVQAMFDRIP